MIKFLAVILLVSSLGLNQKSKEEYIYASKIKFLERKHIEFDPFKGRVVRIRRFVYVYMKDLFGKDVLVESISLGLRSEEPQPFPVPIRDGPYEKVLIKSLERRWIYIPNKGVKPQFITKEYRYKTRDISIHYRVKDDLKGTVIK